MRILGMEAMTMVGVEEERESDLFMPLVMGFGLDKNGCWLRLDGQVERAAWQWPLRDEALGFLNDFNQAVGLDFQGKLVRLNEQGRRIEWWRLFGEEGKRERAVLLSLAWPIERDREAVWQDLSSLGEVWQWRKTRMGEAEHEGQVILEATERLADWWLKADLDCQQKEIYEMVIDKGSEKVRVDDLAGWLDEEGHYWARDKISGQTIRVFDLARDEQERNDTRRLEMMLRKARERAGVKGEGAEFVYRPTGSLSSVTADHKPVNVFEVDEDGQVQGVSLTFPKGTSEAEIESETGKYLTTSRERVEINSRDWGEEFWQGDWQGLPVMNEGLAGTRVGFFGSKNETENAGLRSWVMLGVMGVERATGRATEIGTVKVIKASEVNSVERKVEERRKKPSRLRVAAENGEKEAIRANKITNYRVGFGSKLSVKKPDSLDTDALSYINNRRPAVRNIVIGAVRAGELEVELESVFRRPAAKLPSRVVSIEPRPGSKPPALAIEMKIREGTKERGRREEMRTEVINLTAGRQSNKRVISDLERGRKDKEEKLHNLSSGRRLSCVDNWHAERGEGENGELSKTAAVLVETSERKLRDTKVADGGEDRARVKMLNVVRRLDVGDVRGVRGVGDVFGKEKDGEEELKDSTNGRGLSFQDKRQWKMEKRKTRKRVSVFGEIGMFGGAVDKMRDKMDDGRNKIDGEIEEVMVFKRVEEERVVIRETSKNEKKEKKLQGEKEEMEQVKIEGGKKERRKEVLWLVLPKIRQPGLGEKIEVADIGDVGVFREVRGFGGEIKKEDGQRLKMMRTMWLNPNSNQLALAASVLIVLPHVFLYWLDLILKTI